MLLVCFGFAWNKSGFLNRWVELRFRHVSRFFGFVGPKFSRVWVASLKKKNVFFFRVSFLVQGFSYKGRGGVQYKHTIIAYTGYSKAVWQSGPNIAAARLLPDCLRVPSYKHNLVHINTVTMPNSQTWFVNNLVQDARRKRCNRIAFCSIPFPSIKVESP